MTELDHSTVGELLGRYISGELERDTAAAVAGHLRNCPECRQEEAGLRMLLVPVQGLSASEKSRLRAGLATALSDEAGSPARPEVVRLRRPFLARLAPALGAAALLVVVVIALSRIDLGVRGAGDDAGGARVAQPEAGLDREGTTSGAAEALEAQVAPVQPVFNASAGELEQADLKHLGRTGFTTEQPVQDNAAVSAEAGGQGGPRAARVSDLDFYRDPMLDSLTEQAGDVRVGECAHSVFAGGYKRVAPMYGAFGEYDNQPVLVLGFLWSSANKGPLDNYAIWVWPRSSCAIALGTFSGPVRR